MTHINQRETTLKRPYNYIRPSHALILPSFCPPLLVPLRRCYVAAPAHFHPLTRLVTLNPHDTMAVADNADAAVGTPASADDICYRCKQTGHRAKDCPTKKANQQQQQQTPSHRQSREDLHTRPLQRQQPHLPPPLPQPLPPTTPRYATAASSPATSPLPVPTRSEDVTQRRQELFSHSQPVLRLLHPPLPLLLSNATAVSR